MPIDKTQKNIGTSKSKVSGRLAPRVWILAVSFDRARHFRDSVQPTGNTEVRLIFTAFGRQTGQKLQPNQSGRVSLHKTAH